MIDNIIIKNIKTNKQIEMNKKDSVYIIDSIDWDSPAVTMENYRVPYQIGNTLSGVIVGTRKPIIIGYIVADMSKENVLGMTWKQYYDTQKQKIEQNKLELDKIISVFQDVKIEANGYYLDARPTQPPKYSIDEKSNNEVLCKFQLEFECQQPLFYKSGKTISLASITGLFHFPLIIPPEKVVFGSIARRQSVSIENGGSANVGCTIRIGADGGTVKDPVIYNVNTGDYIGFEDVTLNDGDYILVTTDIGEENAVKHNIETAKTESIIGNVTEGSKYIQIEQGNSFYAYQVKEEYENNIDVSITFTEKYFNIRGM